MFQIDEIKTTKINFLICKANRTLNTTPQLMAPNNMD